MKNSINIKFCTLSILIIIPISILYFNLGDDLFNTKENLENKEEQEEEKFKELEELDIAEQKNLDGEQFYMGYKK
tara:strand:- start:101 stop:325 length:225 start_codon:yes stop_codon:yes gene_type:complete